MVFSSIDNAVNEAFVTEDIRWKQRFDNLDRAYKRLQEAQTMAVMKKLREKYLQALQENYEFFKAKMETS